MSDSTEKVSNLRVVVHKNAEKRKITVKSGENEGQQVEILTFRCYHPKLLDAASNTWDSTWYQVSCYQEESFYLADLIKDHLVLYVSGNLKRSSYLDKNGNNQEGFTIIANKISLDLLQSGVSGFTYKYTPNQHK